VRIRIDLAYDGSAFRGFAQQLDVPTVQGVLAGALSRLCGGLAIATTVAGRTDAGVHADVQVVHCDVPDDVRFVRDLRQARRALDALCGPAITIWAVEAAPEAFDARFSATERRYRYRICDEEALLPLRRHDTWHIGPPTLDVARMHDGGQHLLGEHDFTSFCKQQGDRHMVRRIHRLAVSRDDAGIVLVEVAGKAFCQQMVRSIAGCLLAVGRRNRRPGWVADVLVAKDRHAIGRVAPPHGLTLVGVSFDGAREAGKPQGQPPSAVSG
jgi:tRNA pseudouridine38-40 synthase